MEFVHFNSLKPMVKVLEFGALKYAPDNWRKSMDKRELLNSLLRHIADLVDGEEFDKETNLPHIGHIMCNAMFYSYHFCNTASINASPNPEPLVKLRGDVLADKVSLFGFEWIVTSSIVDMLSLKNSNVNSDIVLASLITNETLIGYGVEILGKLLDLTVIEIKHLPSGVVLVCSASDSKVKNA